MAVGSEIGVGLNGSPVVVDAGGFAGSEVDDYPIGRACDGNAFGVDKLEVAEGEKSVGAARPSAYGYVFAVFGHTVDGKIHAAKHPCLAPFNQLTKAHLRCFGMVSGRFLQETGESPHGKRVVTVAQVVGDGQCVCIVH